MMQSEKKSLTSRCIDMMNLPFLPFLPAVTRRNSQIALTYYPTLKIVAEKRPLQYENIPQ